MQEAKLHQHLLETSKETVSPTILRQNSSRHNRVSLWLSFSSRSFGLVTPLEFSLETTQASASCSRGAWQLWNLTAVAKMQRTPACSRQIRHEPSPSPSEPARAPPRRVAQRLLGIVVSARLPLDWQGTKGAGRSDALGSGAHLRAALASVLLARNTSPCASPAAWGRPSFSGAVGLCSHGLPSVLSGRCSPQAAHALRCWDLGLCVTPLEEVGLDIFLSVFFFLFLILLR